MGIGITRLLGTLLCLATMAVWAGSASAIGFSSPYGPANFTLTTNGGDGSVDTSGAPNSIQLTGSNSHSGLTIDTDYTAVAVASGMVSFDWSYVTMDFMGSLWDSFGYVLNGAFTQLTTDGLFAPQGGSVSFAVALGDVFGFRIHSLDDGFGGASATISNFSAPVPEPAAAMVFVLGLSVVACTVRQRKPSLC